MKDSLTIWLLICITASSALGGARRYDQSRVPKGFHYPESQETIQVDAPIKSKSLAGRVVDPAGFGLDKVLVEHVGAGWRHRRSARFTDSEGLFVFSTHSSGGHYLRLSKPGFKTLLVKVLITKNSQSQLRLALGVSH